MSCMLTIAGKAFDIDEFTLKTGLQPHSEKRKGEPQFSTKPEGDKMTYSVVSFVISDAGFEAISKQIDDAIQYLEHHTAQLEKLAEVTGADAISLDFGVDDRIDDSAVLYETHRFPARLLKIAGHLGIDLHLSVYSPVMDNVLANGTGK